MITPAKDDNDDYYADLFTSRQIYLHVQHLLGDEVRRTAGDSGRATDVGGICDRQTHSPAEVIKFAFHDLKPAVTPVDESKLSFIGRKVPKPGQSHTLAHASIWSGGYGLLVWFILEGTVVFLLVWFLRVGFLQFLHYRFPMPLHSIYMADVMSGG